MFLRLLTVDGVAIGSELFMITGAETDEDLVTPAPYAVVGETRGKIRIGRMKCRAVSLVKVMAITLTSCHRTTQRMILSVSASRPR